MFTGIIQKTAANKRKTSVQKLLSLLVLSVFALTLFAGKAHAQIVGDLDVNIPFQFHAGNTKLPAGKYRIHMMDGSTSALFQVQESDANSAPAKSELIFNKYGNRYFLAKLFDEGNPNGSEVVKSHYETRMSQAALEAQERVPAHHPTQQGN